MPDKGKGKAKVVFTEFSSGHAYNGPTSSDGVLAVPTAAVPDGRHHVAATICRLRLSKAQ